MFEFLAKEKGNLEKDFSNLYGYLAANWKRILGWAVTYYVAQHVGPTAAGKAQAILKILGIAG